MQTVEYYKAKAKELFLSGCNCTQSVVGAFAEDFDIDKRTLMMLVSPFGGGMGRLREVCGTVSGMFFVAGLIYGYSEPGDNGKKAALYAKIQELAALFREKNGSIICREILGLGAGADKPTPEKRTAEYYKKRPCPDLCADAAGIIAQFIIDNPPPA